MTDTTRLSRIVRNVSGCTVMDRLFARMKGMPPLLCKAQK